MLTVIGRPDFALDLADRVDRLAERVARREIERDRHRGLIALVIDLQRADRGYDAGDRRERNRLPDGHAVAVDAARPVPAAVPSATLVFTKMFCSCEGSAWNSRQALQNDLIVVGRRVDGRDLPGAEGVEQFLPDLVDGDAVNRRLLAIDLDRHLRILDVEIGGDVAQPVDLGDLVAHFRRDVIQAARCRSIAACIDTRSW